MIKEIYNLDKASAKQSPKPRILVNKPCLYNLGFKYKKCYKSYSYVQISETKVVSYEDVLKKLLKKYYDFADVFDRAKADELPLYRLYNYKLKFVDDANKIGLLKSRIYFILEYKLK